MQSLYFDEATEAALAEEAGFDMRGVYKTVWEIKQKNLVEMAADRGAFIDQSQSLNVHIGDPNFGKLTSLHFHAWRKGLKTGMYYLRTRAAADAIKFTVRRRWRFGWRPQRQRCLVWLLALFQQTHTCTLILRLSGEAIAIHARSNRMAAHWNNMPFECLAESCEHCRHAHQRILPVSSLPLAPA